MRQITKDLQITIDGNLINFRLTKLDAFSGIKLLRFLMRLENTVSDPTILDLIVSLSDEELNAVITSVLNHTEVVLPAGPHPVMTGPEWGYPEIEHDIPTCMKLLLEGVSWSLSGFFGGKRSTSQAAQSDSAQ